MEFDGGSFDDVEDLRSLTPIERESIRVTSQEVQVNLYPNQAVAIGSDKQECDRIYNQWARTIQNTSKGYDGVQRIIKFLLLVGFLIFAVIGVYSLVILFWAKAIQLTGSHQQQRRPGRIWVFHIYLLRTCCIRN